MLNSDLKRFKPGVYQCNEGHLWYAYAMTTDYTSKDPVVLFYKLNGLDPVMYSMPLKRPGEISWLDLVRWYDRVDRPRFVYRGDPSYDLREDLDDD